MTYYRRFQVVAYSWGEDREDALLKENASYYEEYDEDSYDDAPTCEDIADKGYYVIRWLVTYYEDGDKSFYKTDEFEPRMEEEEE